MRRREIYHLYNLYKSIYVENEKVKLFLITGNPTVYHKVLSDQQKCWVGQNVPSVLK